MFVCIQARNNTEACNAYIMLAHWSVGRSINGPTAHTHKRRRRRRAPSPLLLFFHLTHLVGRVAPQGHHRLQPRGGAAVIFFRGKGGGGEGCVHIFDFLGDFFKWYD